MSNVTLRKMSPTGNEMKSTTQGTTRKQQDFHEVNKRRTFLQDNSWIRKRPEEEKDENYGRVVLNRHNSHDALDRKVNERDVPKATISRYSSDDTLDRISDRNDAAKTYKANTLDNQLTNRSMSMFRSPEATKLQPGGSLNANTSNTIASTSATTPVKKKRQSWFPPPPPGYNASSSTGARRREPGVHPPIPPKPSSPVSSPNQLRRDNRQIHPPKPGVYTETNRSAERNIRSQDRDNIVKVATSLQRSDEGEELDNLIKMNKSLNRNQGLDGLFRANPKVDEREKRAKSLESLIYMSTRTDKDGKGTQSLGSPIKVNQGTDKNEKGRQDLESVVKVNARMNKTSRRSEDLDNATKVNPKGNENTTRKQDLDGLIKVDPETNKSIRRGQSLDNLIKVTPEVNRSNQGSKDLNNFIKVNPGTEKSTQGGQSLDSLIKVTPERNRTNQGNQDLENLIKVIPSANKSSEQGLDEHVNVSPKAVKNTDRKQDLDKLIKVNPEIFTNNQRNQDLANLIKVNPAVIRNNQSQDLDNLIKVKPSALRNTNRDQNLENLIEVNSHVSENKNGRLDAQVNGFTNALHNQSTRIASHSYEARNNLSSNTGAKQAGPQDTVVYTRTYVENSKSPKDGYQENISGKYIQTVYSTSDRSVIERDMCTYCRKPLGVETKMILDELQICCHSTCFKCEICKRPLENLQAGDSIWIYRQTIHCEPCYSKIMDKALMVETPVSYSLLKTHLALENNRRVMSVYSKGLLQRAGKGANQRAGGALLEGQHLQLLLWEPPGSRNWLRDPRSSLSRQRQEEVPVAGKFRPGPIRHLGLGSEGGCGSPAPTRAAGPAPWVGFPTVLRPPPDPPPRSSRPAPPRGRG
ncbi:sciellin [Pongo abelii]|uniref:sciellin n=1 Tax=Pongo abelii TaxID=9601 RepID=UPI0030049DA3